MATVPVTSIDGLRVSYTDTGDGLRVVFVPGLVGSGDWFSYQALGLSDHYRVINYDLRRKPDCTLDLLVDDLVRLLDFLHIHETAVVGYSLGGLIAIRFALTHPQRCLLLALDSTRPGPPHVSDDELRAYYVPGELRSETLVAGLWRRLFGSRPIPDDDSDPLGFLKQACRSLEPAVLSARIRLMKQTDLISALPEVDVPTLVMAGSMEDPGVLSASQILDEVIPDSQLEIIENADQYHFYTSHDRYNTVLADHLAHRIGSP